MARSLPFYSSARIPRRDAMIQAPFPRAQLLLSPPYLLRPPLYDVLIFSSMHIARYLPTAGLLHFFMFFMTRLWVGAWADFFSVWIFLYIYSRRWKLNAQEGTAGRRKGKGRGGKSGRPPKVPL